MTRQLFIYLFMDVLVAPLMLLAVVIIISLLVAYSHYRSERFKKSQGRANAIININKSLVKQGELDGDTAKFLMDTTKFVNINYRHANWAYEEFMRRLTANFKTVTQLVENLSSYNGDELESATETFEVENDEGVKFFLKLQKNRTSFKRTDKDGLSVPRMKASFDVSADVAEDGYINLIFAAQTIVPTQICKDECASNYTTLLHKCLEASKIEYVSTPREDREDELTTWHLVSQGIAGLNFRPYRETPAIVTPTKLNASYEAVHLEFMGEEYNVPMAELLPMIRQQLLNGQNVTLFGSTGTGKSALIDNIVTNMGIAIVRLNSEVIEMLNSADAKDKLVDFCSTREHVFFIYDEAQEAAGNSTKTLKLMSLMEGDLKKLCPSIIAVILALNAKKEDVLPDLIRVGRGGMLLDLGPLSPNKARSLTNILVEEGKTIDKPALEKILKEKDNATLAETYGTVVTPEIGVIIQKKLAAYKVPKVLKVPEVKNAPKK